MSITLRNPHQKRWQTWTFSSRTFLTWPKPDDYADANTKRSFTWWEVISWGVTDFQKNPTANKGYHLQVQMDECIHSQQSFSHVSLEVKDYPWLRMIALHLNTMANLWKRCVWRLRSSGLHRITYELLLVEGIKTEGLCPIYIPADILTTEI